MKALIIGTGPSIKDQYSDIKRLANDGFKLFGVNNTYEDFPLDAWIACDPSWHQIYGKVEGDFDKWHWNKAICDKYGYKYIEGRWGDGLSLDDSYIHYGHSSGYQALGLAIHYGATEVYLCGYDMNYSAEVRHYFSGLSAQGGEYPQELRKYSTFDGLIRCYETIARQEGLPKIYNCTKDSSMKCFEYRDISDL